MRDRAQQQTRLRRDLRAGGAQGPVTPGSLGYMRELDQDFRNFEAELRRRRESEPEPPF